MMSFYSPFSQAHRAHRAFYIFDYFVAQCFKDEYVTINTYSYQLCRANDQFRKLDRSSHILMFVIM